MTEFKFFIGSCIGSSESSYLFKVNSVGPQKNFHLTGNSRQHRGNLNYLNSLILYVRVKNLKFTRNLKFATSETLV